MAGRSTAAWNQHVGDAEPAKPSFHRCEWNPECPYPARLKDEWTCGRSVCVECYTHAIDRTRALRQQREKERTIAERATA